MIKFKIKEISEPGVGSFHIIFFNNEPYVARADLAMAIYGYCGTNISRKFNEKSVCDKIFVPLISHRKKTCFLKVKDVLKVFNESLYHTTTQKYREQKILIRDFLRDHVLNLTPPTKNDISLFDTKKDVENNINLSTPSKNIKLNLRITFINNEMYIAATDFAKTIIYRGTTTNSLSESYYKKISTAKILLMKEKNRHSFLTFLKIKDILNLYSINCSLLKNFKSHTVAKVILEKLLNEYKGDIQMENINLIDSKNPEEVTTLTTSDIEDIKERAEAIKQAFDVSKTDALLAVIALKEEEIGRQLPSLRALFQTK